MPRLTPEQLRAAKSAKAERLGNTLLNACFGGEREIKLALSEIDDLFFTAIESALWFWFWEILPKHFGPGAFQKYGYPNRKDGYLIGKFVGMPMGGKTPRFRFPKQKAYQMAAGGKDPYPLEFSGDLKTQVTMAPATPPVVRRVSGGYRGRIVLKLPAYIRQDDINALLRYVNEDTEQMMNVVQVVIKGALAGA